MYRISFGSDVSSVAHLIPQFQMPMSRKMLFLDDLISHASLPVSIISAISRLKMCILKQETMHAFLIPVSSNVF